MWTAQGLRRPLPITTIFDVGKFWVGGREALVESGSGPHATLQIAGRARGAREKFGEGHLLRNLGDAGAQVLKRHLGAGFVVGLSWGTAVSATVDALEVERPVETKIVQLVGALGARNTEYDGHALVSRLAEKLGGESYYLNAPFPCPTADMASALLETQSVKETVSLGRQVQVALLGVGSTSLQYSGYYLSGYVPLKEMNLLQEAGAGGNVCGIHFDISGAETCLDFCGRLVSIRKPDLFGLPVRIGVAGGRRRWSPFWDPSAAAMSPLW